MRSILVALAGVVLLPGCGSSDPTPPPRWFYTCGDPVCRGYSPAPGLPACTAAETPGETCGPQDRTCDPRDACNRRLACTTSDPTGLPAGCPISRAAFKTDIVYLDEPARAVLRDRLLSLRLATWRYLGDGAYDRRLGFIIDDVGRGPEVAHDGDHVDLYGYTSVAVAAIQAQQREIDTLRAEIAALRQEVARQAGRGESSRAQRAGSWIRPMSWKHEAGLAEVGHALRPIASIKGND